MAKKVNNQVKQGSLINFIKAKFEFRKVTINPNKTEFYSDSCTILDSTDNTFDFSITGDNRIYQAEVGIKNDRVIIRNKATNIICIVAYNY